VTTAKLEPSHSKKRLLIIAGVCGILCPIVLTILTTFALFYAPVAFSLTQNWPCDLTGMGYMYFWDVSRPVVASSITEILSRSSYIVGGILAIIFSIGLFYDDATPSHRLGAVFALVGAGAISVAGIFPEPMGLIHWVPGYASALLFPIAMLLIGGAHIDASHKRLGGLSITLAIVALAGASLTIYGRAAAELTSWIMIEVWLIVVGVRMMWHGSHQMSK
jgi:hypothetical membrane protein